MTVLRRVLRTLVMLALLTTPFTISGQEPGKVYRIGWLAPRGDGTGYSTPFLEKFRELGWVEGENFVMEFRLAEPGKRSRLPDLAADLVRLKVDVIVAVSTPGAVAAKEATTTIPVVMAGADGPVRRGLIASLARPGANVTGLTNNVGIGFQLKQLQLLKEIAPRISRVAWLRNGSIPLPEKLRPGYFKELQAAAEHLGMTMLPFVEVKDASGLPGAFDQITRLTADALVVPPTSVNFRGMNQIVDFVKGRRLPAMFGGRAFVEAGGLVSYWTDWDDLKRRSAIYVDKILKGTDPAELPVEQPVKFELILNRRTAQALGLTITPSLLARADKIIE